MKGTLKRVLSVLLTVSMMLSSFPAMAEETQTTGNTVNEAAAPQAEKTEQDGAQPGEKTGEQPSENNDKAQNGGEQESPANKPQNSGSPALFGVALVNTKEAEKEPELTEQTIDVLLYTDRSMTQLMNGQAAPQRNLLKGTKSTLAAPQTTESKDADGETSISITGELPEGAYAVGWPVDIGSEITEETDGGLVRKAEVLGAYQLELYNADGTKIESTETPVTVNLKLASKASKGKQQETDKVGVVPISGDGSVNTKSPMKTQSSGNTLTYTTKVLTGVALLYQWYHISNHMTIYFTAADGLSLADWLDAGVLIESQRMWYTNAICPEEQSALEALAMRNRDARITAHITVTDLPEEGSYSLYSIIDEQGNLSEDAIRENVKAGDLIVVPGDGDVYGFALVGEALDATVLSVDDPNGTYRVSVSYNSATEIPVKGTKLVVEEIDRESDQYEEYYNRASKALNGMEKGRLFEIRIVDEETGDVYQPAEGTLVDVLIELLNNNYRAGTAACIVHLGNETEELNVGFTRNGNNYAYAFRTGSFSPFMVGYTVDFYYNGYEYSIPGDTGILLSDLFAALDINVPVDDVENVEFTNTDLVSIEKEDSNWRLTSLAPFDTEEKLTVTLTDGSRIEIKVLDEQHTTAADATYKVTNNNQITYWDTFEEAISEINKNNYASTIEILDNENADHYVIHATAAITNTGNITINGNGKTLTRGESVTGNLLTKVSSGQLTITNITIDNGATASSGAVIKRIWNNNIGITTLSGVTINGGSSSGNILDFTGESTTRYTASLLIENSVLDLENCTGSAVRYYADHSGNGSIIEIRNSTIIGPSVNSEASLIYANTERTTIVTIDNSEIYRGLSKGSGVNNSSTGDTIISSSTISGAKSATDSSSVSATSPLIRQGTGALTITDTTVENHVASNNSYAVDAGNADKVYVSGNTTITGNKKTGDNEANLYIKTIVTQTGNLSGGKIGVTSEDVTYNEVDGEFAKTGSSYSGYINFTNDSNSTLVPKLKNSTTLKWTMPDDAKFYNVKSANNVKYYSTLQNAINDASNLDTIQSLVDVYEINTTVSNGKEITIKPGSVAHLTFRRASGMKGDMIACDDNLHLENVTLDGNNESNATGSLLKLNGNYELTLTDVDVTGHTEAQTGVCAVDASKATGLSKVKVSGTTTITGNTTVGGAAANLKTNGENVLHVSANLTGNVGVTTNKNQAGNKFATKGATVTETGSFICDTNPSLIVRIDNNNLLWDSIDNVANMFGNPNTTIDNLKTYPAADDLAVLPGNAVAGDENEDSDNPFMTWKSASYNNDNNSADITLNFFKKQINIKLDFIFVIDETGTMTDNKSANGYTTSQAKWARYAAITASKGIFQVNSQYAENGAENRIAIVSYSGHGHTTQIYRSGWMTDTTAALIWASQTKVGGGDTYHDVVVNDILSLANASKTVGHTPVLVWMCDYTARYGKGHSGCVTEAHMNQIKAAIPNRYAMLIYQAYNNTYKARMGYLTDRHFYMSSHSDPSTLVTPIIQIIRDAVAKCATDLVVNDEFVNGIAAGADSNGITSSGAETNAATYDSASNIAQWKLVNDNASDNRLNAATMFTKVINIPMTDDVYSGSMPTNGNLVVKEGDTVVNKIPAGDSPLLKKPLTLVNRKTSHTGDFIASTFAVYKKEGETETLLWKGTTDATTGKADIPWAATDEEWTSEDEGGAAAFLPGTNYILKELTPATGTVLPSGDWLISVDSNYVITAAAENHAESEDRILAVGYYSGKMEIYDDIEPMIHFDLNGGTWTHEGGADNAVQFRMNETHHTYTVTSDVPVREGFAFVGWLASVTGNDEVNGKTYKAGDEIRFYRHTDNDDVTLTAQWAEALTLTVIKTWTDNTAAAGADQSNGNNSITLTFREEDGDTLIATDFIGITQTDPNVTVGTDGKVTLSKSTEDDGQGGTTQVWPASWTVMVPATAKGVTEHVNGYVDDVKANFSNTDVRIGGVNVAAYTVRITNTRAIVKITDNSGNLLYKADGTPAVYTTATALEDAFGEINNVNIAFYTTAIGSAGLPYEGTDYQVQMLVENYAMTGGTNLERGKTVTLTTASERASDGFPYTGAAGTKSTITRASSFASASMITNKGALTLTNITLDGNNVETATSVAGGIVNCDGMSNGSGISLTVTTGATLQNSRANRRYMYYGGGGAIYALRTALTINGGTFINNHSGSSYDQSGSGDYVCHGGAIYVSQLTELTVTGATFIGNTSLNSGGAIYIDNSYSKSVSIENCTFSNNKAYVDGGAICNNASKLTVTNSTFTENKTTTGNGGAVYSRFLPNDPNEISGSTFTKNEAALDGGAMYIYPTGGALSAITNCEISENKAGRNGGGILKTGYGSLAITGGTISQNNAIDGGAICYDRNHRGHVNISTITNCAITGNESTGNGGAIYFTADSDSTYSGLSISGGTITGNTAKGNGGAIYYNRNKTKLQITNTPIGGASPGDGNSAANGGAIYINADTSSTIGATITGNTATGDGGAIYIASGSSGTTTIGGTITGNTAGGHGGAVYTNGFALQVGGTITENSANGNGGAIFANSTYTSSASGTTIKNNAKIQNNRAGMNGGAVYLAGNKLNIGGTNTEITGNVATLNGGAVYISGGTTTISGGAITGNTGADGGISGEDGYRINFADSPTVYDNHAAGNSTEQRNVVITKASNIKVTGTMKATGKIGVYSLSEDCDSEGEQFAVCGYQYTNSYFKWNLDAFWNDKTNDAAGNPLRGMYGDGERIIWSIGQVTITKQVTGTMGDTTKDFTFTISVDGLTAEELKAINPDGLTQSATDPCMFTLKGGANGNRIILYVPYGKQVTLQETNAANYTTTIGTGRNAPTGMTAEGVTGPTEGADSETKTITFTVASYTTPATITVVNNLDAVSPTGISFTYAPYILMLLCGAALMLLARKKRRA